MAFEEWNIPADYAELVKNGNASYSIIGVVTQDNIDAMGLFLREVAISSDLVEVDDGTQVFLRHPDTTKLIQIDSGGLGDFDRNGYDVTIVDRASVQTQAAGGSDG